MQAPTMSWRNAKPADGKGQRSGPLSRSSPAGVDTRLTRRPAGMLAQFRRERASALGNRRPVEVAR
jgi:hypothetical protein